MLFKFGKCIYMRHGHLDVNYKMGDIVLGTTAKKDLGVTISALVKVSEQCGIAALKVNQILGLINVKYKENN